MNGTNDHEELRQYLLGILKDEVSLGRIEMRLMTDDKFAEEIELAEGQLIEDYLDGELSDQDRTHFDRHFLAAPERRSQLRLTENLRTLSAAEAQKIAPQKAKRGWFDGILLPSNQWLRFAAAALILIAIGLAVWRFAIYESATDKSLAQLRTAFEGKRPIEPRITALPDHVPYSITRGPATAPADPAALERAQIYLADATRDPNDGAAHHALALIFLTQGKYDQAQREFDLALAAAPKDAAINSDAGAAYLEMAKKAEAENDGAKTLELLDKSLKHLDQAISLDPKLLPARFNRGLCLEALNTRERARQAWREYLELDGTSKWADEARLHLQELESRENTELSAEDLERQFLDAFAQQDSDGAWRLLSQNRELIQEKYLPQRLAMSLVSRPPEQRELFKHALSFAGDLERKNTADPFAGDIARFYKEVPEAKIGSLRLAHEAIRKGVKYCLTLEYRSALDEFSKARVLFSAAGNVWEAKLSEYFVGYCLFNTQSISESIEQFRQIVEYAQGGGYKWLQVTAYYWLSNGYDSLRQVTLAKKTGEAAVALADEIGDTYALQRNLLELAIHGGKVGQRQYALRHLQPNLRLSADVSTSRRQQHRNLFYGTQILIDANLDSAAGAVALEAARLADELGDPMFQTLSRNHVALASTELGNFDEARQWIRRGQQSAEAISDEASRTKMIANSMLARGYLERNAGNFTESERLYGEAAKLYEAMQMPAYLYIAQKGKLLNYQALGRADDLERQIPVTIRLNEESRAGIREERERISYFDTQESIYDIAIDFELARGRPDRAYDYVESSSARSLLDWLQQGLKAADTRDQQLEGMLRENATPLGLSAIRAKLPDRVQILQFSVLEDKTLIWLISRDKFILASTEIRSADLRRKVEEFLRLTKQPDESSLQAAGQLSGELFRILIEPVATHLNTGQMMCLIPDKVLFRLPFAALRVADGDYLIKKFEISYAASANAFLRSTEIAGGRASSDMEHLLTVGNPAYDRREFSDLPDLPTAEVEARRIAQVYPSSQLLLGRAATKASFLSSAPAADVIHFAGHYVTVDDDPQSSYLLLASANNTSQTSMLTNRELVGTRLPRAKLLVLSACQTAGESDSRAEGLIGLSRTFLAAGVPLVVASYWSVDTRATTALMDRFHHFRRAEHLATSAALRRAQLDLANDSSGIFNEPYYWAAFAVFGGSSEF